MNMRIRPFPAFVLGALFSATLGGLLPLVLLGALSVRAQGASANTTVEVSRLKDEIAERNNRLAEIEKEIARYRNELQKVGGEKATLQNALRELELERKKVISDIARTQNRIGATDLEIQKLGLEIGQVTSDITEGRQTIEGMLRRLHETDAATLIEALLVEERIADFWATVDELAQVRDALRQRVRILSDLKAVLEGRVGEQEIKRGDLLALKKQYAGQQKVLDVNKDEKDQLLTKTKNEEAAFQSLLAERQAAKAHFERELRELEARLQFVLDPKSIPKEGTTVFRWPLDGVRLTQHFGNTEFSRTAAYNGQGHNGIDFGAPRGTSVRAALSGEVAAINTQVAPMCQYGKWVLIRHGNGLTTLYAHLSVVSVNKGDTIATGDTVGYSGDTGYAIGPHLHFTVYASDAVQFTQYTCKSGITLTIPVAAYTGYLNPLLYLPPL